MQRGEQCDGKGCAFLRVGAGTKLVEEDEGFLIGLIPEGYDVGHMAGKCTQALLYRLLISDIRVDFREQGKP